MKMYWIGKNLWEMVTGTEILGENATKVARKKFKKRENQALAFVCVFIRRFKPPDLNQICDQQKMRKAVLWIISKKTRCPRRYFIESCTLHEWKNVRTWVMILTMSKRCLIIWKQLTIRCGSRKSVDIRKYWKGPTTPFRPHPNHKNKEKIQFQI